MSSLLLVDDNLQLLVLYKTILEQAGHHVRTADNRVDAVKLLHQAEPDIVITDLRVPELEDGLSLIRSVKDRAPDDCKPQAKLIVISGWTADLSDTPEEHSVDCVLAKPVRLELLLRSISELALVLLLFLFLGTSQALWGETFRFSVARRAEVVADLDMSSPGSSWAESGREAALAELKLDGRRAQHIMLYAGERPFTYGAFLGSLDAGRHELRVERSELYSARDSGLKITAAHFREYAAGDPYWTALANAPILYARTNTIGRFTDIPLFTYCERLVENGRPVFEYTVIFSNEDGGTSTRALMARWGRATDVEYIYRAWMNERGSVERSTVQGRDHKEEPFHGRHEEEHPVLIPSTDNNMVSGEGTSPIRYQIPPLAADLASHSREQIMDEHPIAYQVMGQELQRERKLRPFGTVDGETISDPRNYLYIEAAVRNRQSGIAALVRLRGEHRWFSSHLGRNDYAISRDGWVRTTVELPPGTTPDAIEEVGFECLVASEEKSQPLAGMCRFEAVSKVFMLDAGYSPRPALWKMTAPIQIPTGQILTFRP